MPSFHQLGTRGTREAAALGGQRWPPPGALHTDYGAIGEKAPLRQPGNASPIPNSPPAEAPAHPSTGPPRCSTDSQICYWQTNILVIKVCRGPSRDQPHLHPYRWSGGNEGALGNERFWTGHLYGVSGNGDVARRLGERSIAQLKSERVKGLSMRNPLTSAGRCSSNWPDRGRHYAARLR
jgi:hypothetical protein